jgi:arylsulfatase A-like enzyme
VRAAGQPHGSERERYDRLVEAADRMVGRVVDAIAKRGLADSTIVIVVGDHGEGFGDKGVRQHATNFYEEGLRVPWVMVGPGLTPKRIDADASLLDLAPTVLALLGVATNVPPAHDVLTAPAQRALPFGCWYDASCRGFVQDRKKAVFIPETGQSFWFDLARDPLEREPRPFTDALAKTFGEIDKLLDAHRIRSWPDDRTEMTAYPSWRCEAKQPCKHVGAP